MAYELDGPYADIHYVLVDGWRVPFLQAEPANGGRIFLNLDHRFCIDIPVADAEKVIPFIADAIAIGMGYTCHPRAGWDGPKQATPFTRVHGITSVTTEPAPPDDDPLARLDPDNG